MLWETYLVGESFALEYVRHKLIETAGQNVQQRDAHDAEGLARRHRIVGVGQMQNHAGGQQFGDLFNRESGARNQSYTIKSLNSPSSVYV